MMSANVLGPMRVIEVLRDVEREDGLIGTVWSGQGSIANSEGQRDVYRAGKAALDMATKKIATR